ncbi:hypothetical protein F5884DRAFT_801366 [Xylogone sp. PMI_703]|nr:hypothetical protein F5884DRAFT_801366 [Xylogone sp. PMI_703]
MRQRYGAPFLDVSRRDLQRLLYDKAIELGVKVNFNAYRNHHFLVYHESLMYIKPSENRPNICKSRECMVSKSLIP